MPQDKVKVFLEDMSLSSTYEMLEWGSNDDEIKNVAAKARLKVPSKDIAIFKCKYAMANEENRNGCTLPRKEVKKALMSLNLKAIDKDHFREAAVGAWLEADLDDNDIIAYGAFWKSNFPKDYEEIKKRMKEGSMKISFEAWGDRVITGERSYELHNIEFAGGALLFDSQPAFPDAEVMEFATNRVLEFAKIIEDGKKKKVKCQACKEEFIWEDLLEVKIGYVECPKCKGHVDQEGKFFVKASDVPVLVNPDRKILRIVTEEVETTTELPNDTGYSIERKRHLKRTVFYDDNTQSIEENDLESTDKITQAQVDEKIKLALVEYEEENDMFLSSLIEGDDDINEEGMTVKDMEKKIDEMKSLMVDMSDEEEKKKMMMKIDEMKKKQKMMEEAKKLTYKERKNISDDDFAVVVTVKNKTTGDPRKIRMFPIKDPAHVRNALARLPQATETLKKLGVSVEEVKKKILKKARELNLTDLLKRHEGEVGKIMDEVLKKYSKASVEELIKFLETEIVNAKEVLGKNVTELASKVQEVSTKDTELASVKTELETIKVEIATAKTEKEAMVKAAEDSKLIVENSKLEIEKLKAEFATIKAELDKRLAAEETARIAEIAALAKSRKDEVGEYAKDMSDEDILNDLKFENAKLKKERDEALAKANIAPAKDAGLNAGKIATSEDVSYTKQKTVQEKAWNEKE